MFTSIFLLLYLIATILPASAIAATGADDPCKPFVDPAPSAAVAAVPAATQEVKLSKEQVDLAAFEAVYKHRYTDAERVINTILDYLILASGDATLPWDDIDKEFQQKFSQAIPPQDLNNQTLYPYDDIIHTAIDVVLTIPQVKHVVPYIWKQLSDASSPDSDALAYLGDSATKVASSAWRYSKAARLLAQSSQIIAAARECAKVNPEYARIFDERDIRLNSSILDDAQTILENHPDVAFPEQLRGRIAGDGTITISLEELKAFSVQELDKIHGSINEIQDTLNELDRGQDIIIDYIQDQQTKELKRKLAEKKAAEAKLKLDAAKSAISIFVTLLGQSDPKFAKELNVVATSSLQVGQALTGWLEAVSGLNGLEKLTSLSTVVMTGNVLGAVMNVVALFGEGKPTPEQQILEEIGKLRQQVNELRTEMHSRFDRIDTGLNAIYTTMNQRFDQIDLQLGKINGKVTDVQLSLISLDLKLSEIERNNFELMNSSARLELVEAINGGIGYLERVGSPMPYEPYFESFENKLHTWATRQAFAPILAGPSQRDISDAALFEELSKYPLDLNVNYLNSWLLARGLPGITNTPIASPRDWLFASRAYTQLGLEWPEHMERVGADRQETLDEVGEDIQTALQNISTVQTPNGPQGNTLLFTNVITIYNGKLEMLDSAIQAGEVAFMNKVQNEYLKRAEPFDLYGGLDQELSYQPPGLQQMQGSQTLLTPPSNIIPRIPHMNRYKLAEYLTLFENAQFKITLSGILSNGRIPPGCKPEPDVCPLVGELRVTVGVLFGNVTITRMDLQAGTVTLQVFGGDRESATDYVVRNWDSLKTRFEAQAVEVEPTPEIAQQRLALFNDVTAKLGQRLTLYQQEFYRDVLEAMTTGNLRTAVIEIAGMKKLIESLVALGFPRALSSDEFLRAMLFGNQQLVNDGQIIQTYTLSATQPITGTSLLVNPRLVIGETANKRADAFAGLLNEYLDAITAGTHSEVPDFVNTTRRALAITMQIARLELPTTPEPPTPEPPTPEPSTPDPTPDPSTPDPNTPGEPLPTNATHLFVPLIQRE